MNENQSQNLSNNNIIFNDYKKYIKKPLAKIKSRKIGEACGVIAILLFVSGIILALIGIVMPGVFMIVSSILPCIFWILYGGILIPIEEELCVFIRKNNQIYYIDNTILAQNNEFAQAIASEALGGPNFITVILILIGISSRNKNIDKVYELLNQKSFDDPYFINSETHIQSIEIKKETSSYLKIYARFENQGRKLITIYNIYEDYNELITEIKKLEMNK